MPGAYPRVEPVKDVSLVYAATLFTNNRLGWKRPAKHSSLLRIFTHYCTLIL